MNGRGVVANFGPKTETGAWSFVQDITELESIGWSKQPLHDARRSRGKGPRIRFFLSKLADVNTTKRAAVAPKYRNLAIRSRSGQDGVGSRPGFGRPLRPGPSQTILRSDVRHTMGRMCTGPCSYFSKHEFSERRVNTEKID